MTRPLENKTAIITGASRGLGFQIATSYIEAGASVLLCARKAPELEQAKRALLPLLQQNQRIVSLPADVSLPDDVHAVVESAIGAFGRLDILVNNAGIQGPKGLTDDVDWLEWMRAIEINLFGPVLMCRAVLPHFKAAGRGKIVQISGGGATSPMPRLSAYAASKAAVIRFVETLAEETREYHIDVNAIAPGALNTRMLEEVLEAGPEKVGAALYERAVKQKESGGASPKKGADLAVFLGSELSNGITGKLIAALWDPWQSLPERLDDLRATDIYTLRRILPEDRGRNWEGQS